MSDVRSVTLTATGTITGASRMRIKGISFLPVATPGSIVIKDGGASGTTVLSLDIGSGSTTYIEFPGCGLLVQSAPHATLTTVTSVTFFYG